MDWEDYKVRTAFVIWLFGMIFSALGFMATFTELIGDLTALLWLLFVVISIWGLWQLGIDEHNKGRREGYIAGYNDCSDGNKHQYWGDD